MDSGQKAKGEVVRGALRAGGKVSIRALGSSMWPWVRSGDVLVVAREAPSGMRRGHVAFYARHGSLFAHRLVGKLRRGGEVLLVTHGDALPCGDAPVRGREILGRVVRIRRGNREIDLETWPRSALGWLLAHLSRCNRWTYPVARRLVRLLRLVRAS